MFLKELWVHVFFGFLVFLPLNLQGVVPSPQLCIITDETQAALAILDERRQGRTVREESWARLWQTEGFKRLQQREDAMGRQGIQDRLREYLLKDETLAQRDGLRQSLEQWKKLDATQAGRRAAAYLADGVTIRASVYPVIKPATNSFVFDIAKDPAIFFYMDPTRGPAELENILAHELHHVGSAICPSATEPAELSEEQRQVRRWLGGFGEGIAVLAAAGGPDVHPHASSPADAWLVWERDVQRFNQDLRKVETFFQQVLAKKIPEEEQGKIRFSFYSGDSVPQGPFYTVGWKMAALVERTLGRKAVIAAVCDPPSLLTSYNQAVAKIPRVGDEGLAMWSEDFLKALGVGAEARPNPSAPPTKNLAF